MQSSAIHVADIVVDRTGGRRGEPDLAAPAIDVFVQSAGIPCELKSEIGFSFDNPDDVARVNKYMANIANPLVLVRGWARGNPSADQVIAQYRAGK